jgi:hypothetical protein
MAHGLKSGGRAKGVPDKETVLKKVLSMPRRPLRPSARWNF